MAVKHFYTAYMKLNKFGSLDLVLKLTMDSNNIIIQPIMAKDLFKLFISLTISTLLRLIHI